MDLSPPASNVRMMSGRPSSAWATARYACTCSSSSGGAVRFRNRNSVRNNPTPSAPDFDRFFCAPATEPMLAAISIALPSLVMAAAGSFQTSLFFCCLQLLCSDPNIDQPAGRLADKYLTALPIQNEKLAILHGQDCLTQPNYSGNS